MIANDAPPFAAICRPCPPKFPFLSRPVPDAYSRTIERLYAHYTPSAYTSRLAARTAWTNRITYSEDFSSVAWIKAGLTVTTAAFANPADGKVTGCKLVEDATTGNHLTYQDFTWLSGPVVCSVFAAEGERRYIQLYAATTVATSGGYANFDLRTGQVVNSVALGTGAAVLSASCVAVGNGVFRCVLVVLPTAGTTMRVAVSSANASGAGVNPSYTGASGYGFYAWGLEAKRDHTYNSDFSVATDGWGQNSGDVNLQVTGNVDAISGENDNLRVLANAAGRVLQIYRLGFTPARVYRVYGRYFAEASCGVSFLGAGVNGVREDAGGVTVVEGSWQNFQLDVTPQSVALQLAGFTSAGGTGVATLASGKSIYFRLIAVVPIDYCSAAYWSSGGPYVSTLGSARTLSAPDLDCIANSSAIAPDPFAWQVAESDLQISNSARATFSRTFARIPATQYDYDWQAFQRPILHDLKSGTTYAVSFEDNRSWLFTGAARIGVSTLAAPDTPYLTVQNNRNALGHVLVTIELDNSVRTFYTDDTDTTIKNALSNAMVGTTASAANFYVGRDTNRMIINWNGVSPRIKSYSISDTSVTVDSAPSLGIASTAGPFTLSTNQGLRASTRSFTTTAAHSGAAGGWVALWNGDKLVATTRAISASGTSLTIPLDALQGKDEAITHIAFATQATQCLANGPKECRVRLERDFYLAGVTMLAAGTTQATPDDIPLAVIQSDPQAWLDVIVAGTTFAIIAAGQREQWMGPIVSRQVTKIQMADALVAVSAT